MNNNQKSFDLNRKHTAGQFLRAHPDALRVMNAHRKEAHGMFALGLRAAYVGK